MEKIIRGSSQIAIVTVQRTKKIDDPSLELEKLVNERLSQLSIDFKGAIEIKDIKYSIGIKQNEFSIIGPKEFLSAMIIYKVL